MWSTIEFIFEKEKPISIHIVHYLLFILFYFIIIYYLLCIISTGMLKNVKNTQTEGRIKTDQNFNFIAYFYLLS